MAKFFMSSEADPALLNGKTIAIIGYGSTDPSIDEARHMLMQKGVKTSYLRLRALPLADSARDFIAAHKRSYVVELNSDAQMCQLLRLHAPELATSIKPCNHNDGMPLTAAWITAALLEKELLHAA